MNYRWIGVITLIFSLSSSLVFADSRDFNFSAFTQEDIHSVGQGEMCARNVPVSLRSGMGVQTLFFIKAEPEAVVKKLQHWDSSKYTADTDVTQYGELNQPVRLEDFEKICVDGDSWLQDATVQAAKGKPELNLSRAERDEMGRKIGNKGDDVAVAPLWRTILLERSQAFQKKGFDGLNAYDLSDGGEFKIKEAWDLVFSAGNAVIQNFAGLWSDFKKQPPLEKNSPVYYFEKSKVNGHPGFDLGVVAFEKEGDVFKVIDFTYFNSSDYYSALTFYEIHPRGGGGSLVWRGDYVLSPEVEALRGVERMAAEKLFLREVKTSNTLIINDLQKR